MTRAVVELFQDSAPFMSALSRAVEGCAYDPLEDLLGFHFKDMSVLMENRRLTIVGAEDEAKARKLLDWLKSKLDAAAEDT